jgi:hypothetical protein
MITAHKLEEVDLETTLKTAPHIAVWLVPKNEVDIFTSRRVEGLHLTRRQPVHGSPRIQPVAPDVDTLGENSLFDDDSIGDEYIPAMSIESGAGDAAEESPQRLDPSNSALVAHDRGYREGGGQLSQDESHEVSGWRSKSVSPDTSGIAAGSFEQSTREASPAAEHRTLTRNETLTGAASTAPPAVRGSNAQEGGQNCLF